MFFQELSQAEQDLVEGAAGFPSAHHMDINGREVPGIALEDGAVRGASTYGFPDIGDQPLDRLFFGLVHEHAQRIDERQTGDQQGGQLPRHQGHIGDRQNLRAVAKAGTRRRLRPAAHSPGGTFLFRHLGGEDAVFTQFQTGDLGAFGIDDAGRSRTVRLKPSILIDRHAARPRPLAVSCA